MMKLSRVDNSTCLDIESVILYGTKDKILGIDSNSPYTTTFPSISGAQISNLTDLDLNFNEKTLYWIDNGLKALKKLQLNGSKSAEILTKFDKMEQVSGLAVEKSGQNVYFSGYNLEQNSAHISVIGKNGLYRRILLSQNEGLKRPRLFGILEAPGTMFWFDYENSEFFTAKLDGATKEKLPVSTDSVKSPKGFGILERQEVISIYWTNANGKTFMFDTKTNHAKSLVFPPLMTPSLVNFDARGNSGLLYGTDRILQKFSTTSGNKIDHGSWTTLAVEVDIAAVKIFQKNDTNFASPCEIRPYPCPQLCVSVGDLAHKCVCAQGYDFLHGLCKARSDILLFVTDTSIEGLRLGNLDSQSQIAKFSNVQHPKSIAVDSRRDLLYWIEGARNELWKANRDSSNATKLLNGGNSKLLHLAVDWVTGHLYFSSRQPGLNQNGLIEMLLPDKRTFTIIQEHEDVPSFLCVDSRKGLLFYKTSKGIHKVHLNGENKQTMTESNNITDMSLNLEKSQLCYVDRSINSLICIDYNGENPIRLISFSQENSQVTSVAMHNDTVYYYDRYPAFF